MSTCSRLKPDGRKIIYLWGEMSTPAIIRCIPWDRELQHTSGLSLWGTTVNLPQIVPTGSFHRTNIWCGKDEEHHMGRIKKCSGGTEKVHASVPNSISIRVALREEEGCRRLSRRFFSFSQSLAFMRFCWVQKLCGVRLPATWQTFYIRKTRYRSTIAGSFKNNSKNKKGKNYEIMKIEKRK